jgi:hypothetical protein
MAHMVPGQDDMRREDQVIEVVPDEQLDSLVLERASEPFPTALALARWIASSDPKRDQTEGVDRLQNISPIRRDVPIVQTESHPRAIDRAQAFEANQLTGYSVGDRRPDL